MLDLLENLEIKEFGITGTSWRPKLPVECDYEQELKEIMNNKNDLERCIDLFCWIQRSQMFLDGNKRVANIVANKIVRFIWVLIKRHAKIVNNS